MYYSLVNRSINIIAISLDTCSNSDNNIDSDRDSDSDSDSNSDRDGNSNSIVALAIIKADLGEK